MCGGSLFYNKKKEFFSNKRCDDVFKEVPYYVFKFLKCGLSLLNFLIEINVYFLVGEEHGTKVATLGSTVTFIKKPTHL